MCGFRLTCSKYGLSYPLVLFKQKKHQDNGMKTFLPKVDEISRKWWVVDADGVILGKLASKVADVLRGKNKPCFTPHLDTGDFVVVINAEKVKLTGKKEQQKIYRKHSGYLGGMKERTAAQVRMQKPERMIQEAVWGMLPKGRLGRKQYRKLKVVKGAEHEHAAQQPGILTIS
jgi:large subunit ribosomal protein L13